MRWHLQKHPAAPELGGKRLLAVDTSIGTAVAASCAAGVFEAWSDDPRGHAELVGPMLQAVLAAAGLTPSELDGVVMGVGPGPFTGLRVGMAAARAFAFGAQVPLYPVQGHAAVALEALAHGAVHDVRVLQDARRRELFVTGFSGLDWAGVPVCSAASMVVPRSDFPAEPNDVWPERISGAALVRLAGRMLQAGVAFADGAAVYLRQPDVKEPTGPKRVLP